jgi:hypothetical protein
MNIEKEEKVLKALGLFTLLVFVPLNTFVIKDLGLKFLFIVPMLFLYTFFYGRKFIREKKQNKDLASYKKLLFFIFLSFLMFIVSIFYVV